MVDIILVILAFLFGLVGIIGSVVPAVPGPPIAYVGLWLMKWSGCADFSTRFMIIFLILTIVITIVDNILPVWMTKRFGGSRYATIGSLIGLIIGLIFAPWGILLGPFLGALIGELIHDHENIGRAFRVAGISFVAFIVGTGAKITLCAAMIFFMIISLF